MPLGQEICTILYSYSGATFVDRPGVAILITCDYETNDIMESLPGTKEDAQEMRETFRQLGYVIHERQNPTREQMITLVKEISDELGGYDVPKEEEGEKVIIFAFSGHGDTIGQVEMLLANDGVKIAFKMKLFLVSPSIWVSNTSQSCSSSMLAVGTSHYQKRVEKMFPTTRLQNLLTRFIT